MGGSEGSDLVDGPAEGRLSRMAKPLRTLGGQIVGAAVRGLEGDCQALLIQEGLELSGAGEKLSDRGSDVEPVDYDSGWRANIDVMGNVTRNYFSPDALARRYREAGRRRDSSTLHEPQYFDAETICGCFQSTIADTAGSTWWERVDGRDRLYAPVGRPGVCGGGACGGRPGRCGGRHGGRRRAAGRRVGRFGAASGAMPNGLWERAIGTPGDAGRRDGGASRSTGGLWRSVGPNEGPVAIARDNPF